MERWTNQMLHYDYYYYGSNKMNLDGMLVYPTEAPPWKDRTLHSLPNQVVACMAYKTAPHPSHSYLFHSATLSTDTALCGIILQCCWDVCLSKYFFHVLYYLFQPVASAQMAEHTSANCYASVAQGVLLTNISRLPLATLWFASNC